MKDLIKALVKLLKVKSIITLEIITVTSMLAYQGKISTELFMVIVTAIVTYYFTKDNDLK